MEQKYEGASQALDDKAKVSGAAKERADKLRDRAKKLAEAANGRLNDLQGKLLFYCDIVKVYFKALFPDFPLFLFVMACIKL